MKFPPADICVLLHTVHGLHMQYMHTYTEHLGQTYPQFSLVTFLWHCVRWDYKKPLKQPLNFHSSQLSTRTLQSWLTCCRNNFCCNHFCPRRTCHPHSSSFFSLMCRFASSSLHYLDSPVLSLRPDVAVHQPWHPHLYWMFGDPQGAGSPLLQNPVPHSGRPQHLRALGKSTGARCLADSPHIPRFCVAAWVIPLHWLYSLVGVLAGRHRRGGQWE